MVSAPERTAQQALARLRKIKGDPSARPYILLVGSLEQAMALVINLPESNERWMREAWPGPLTLLLPAAVNLPEWLVKGGRVAVRCPGRRLLRDLALSLEEPLISTSANRAGGKAPADFKDVEPGVLAACDLAVDAGVLAGSGSTLARVESDGALTILRPGLWVPKDGEV